MPKLLPIALIACLAYLPTLPAASAAASAKHYTPCTLMTLQDAKTLIGADAEPQPESTTDSHCYYRSSAGAAYLHIASADGHLWTDYKSAGKPVKGVADEAYFYPDQNPMGNTLMVRKGDVVIMVNAHSNALSDEQIQNAELAFSRKMASRL